MTRPVYIRRIGHASALGLSAREAARALADGRRNLSRRELLGESWPWFALPLAETDWLARARHALELVANELAAGTSPELPLFVGSSSNGAGALEAIARAAGVIDMHCEGDIAIFTRHICSAFGNGTIPWLFSTACTSGLTALEAAFTLIGQGELDEALALGVDFACDSTLAGFASLGLVARAEDDTEGGLILGEAVAGLRLAATPDPDCQGWRIAACRLNIDSYAPTMPTPDGRIIADNIAATLDDAKLRPLDIALVKPHRGGLPGTDEAESAALDRVFGVHRPPEISFKHQIGHTLGACGPAELTALLALLGTPAGQALHGFPRHVLFNLAGFGGNTATLIVERHPPANRGEPA